MLQIVFTLDYEIHGNGDGCPMELMVKPTARLLELLRDHDAKLTIMADVAEILRFREYKESTGRDGYHCDAIEQQLRRAIADGHDVQLHIHSSYFNASHDRGSWVQDWSEYDFARLPFERMEWMVRTCKFYLEALLRPVNPNYSCIAFRAANWSVSPSRNVVRALSNNGIRIDTSVFKYGRRQGAVNFDYSNARSAIEPWRVSAEDICQHDEHGTLWELPIYSEKRWIGAFLSLGRLQRIFSGLGHKVCGSPTDAQADGERGEDARAAKPLMLRTAFGKQAWKADFNQCSGRQLIGAIERGAARRAGLDGRSLPFVLIGHSKLFGGPNARSLRPFLKHVARHGDRYRFRTLRETIEFEDQWGTE